MAESNGEKVKDVLIKLARLANNNPNENEANSAARRVCKLLAEDNFAVINSNPIGAGSPYGPRNYTWNPANESQERAREEARRQQRERERQAREREEREERERQAREREQREQARKERESRESLWVYFASRKEYICVATGESKSPSDFNREVFPFINTATQLVNGEYVKVGKLNYIQTKCMQSGCSSNTFSQNIVGVKRYCMRHATR